MKYGILLNGVLQLAPSKIVLSGKQIWNPTAEQLAQAGYKEIHDTDMPGETVPDGQHYESYYEDKGTYIELFWEIKEDSEESLTAIKEQKIKEMNEIQQSIINNGTEVEMEDGSKVRYTITNNDQNSLNSLSIQNLYGLETLPWHPADENEPCRFYTEEDFSNITKTCSSFVIYHVTYFRDLRRYIRSLPTKEAVNKITYGTEIPEEFQSEVLVALTNK